ncbi:MAG: AfsR/SARP family transcriptional regulator [Solirubrobacteraceae bacterium]
MRALARRILALLSLAILFGAVWLLWESRPELATIGDGGRERLFGFLAWLGCLLLAAGLLYRVITGGRGQSVSSPQVRNLRRRETRRRRGSIGGYADHAFPLIAKGNDVGAAAGRLPVGVADVPRLVDGQAAQAPKRPSTVAISLLGPPTVALPQKQARGLRGGTRELLFYLALRPGGAHREQIIDALWPEQSREQARRRLWRAAADARAQLGEASLRRDGEQYRLNRSVMSVDIDQLEQLLTELDRAGEAMGQLPLLEQALALFSGEPLVGSDFPWAENEQRRLQTVRLDLFERAGRALLTCGDPAGALSRAEEGLAVEPYNERLARLAMRAEAALGLRKAVMHRYERLSEVLEEQLGLQPQLETRRLYRQLLGQDQELDPLGAAWRWVRGPEMPSPANPKAHET